MFAIRNTFTLALFVVFLLGTIFVVADGHSQAESDAESARQQSESDAESSRQQSESDAESSRQQSASDAGSSRQQKESDAESARQQAESDAEAARQQAESEAEAARQQAASDLAAFLQQAESDFQSKVKENRDRKVNLEIVSEENESGDVIQKIKFRGIGVETDLVIEGLGEEQARVRLSDGNYQDVNIIPSTAFKIAIEKLRTTNINIRLEEFQGEDFAAIYVADSDKTIKILGIFETEHNLAVEIGVEDGEIIVEDKPWWWFFVEEVDEIEEVEFQLIKPIQDIILMKNEERSLDLNEYFLNAAGYSVSDPENISVELKENVLTISPETDWLGTTSMVVTASQGEKSLDSLFTIIVSEDNLSVQTIQFSAILDEPVRWKKIVRSEGQKRVKLKLPKNSENVIIKTDTGLGNVISSVETEEDLEIEVEEEGDYDVEYVTEAPFAIEKEISQGKEEITIVGPEEIHYTDVLAFKRLSEEVPSEAVTLFWITESGKKEVEVDKYDLNNNSLIDYIEWVVPSLSNETYELELNILNIQSYPTVGGDWEVRFTTAGTANLTISAANDTAYGSSVPDDLTPLELRCGESILSYGLQGNSISYADWNCDNEIGFWIVTVLTPGVHTQEFNFGGLIGYAYNFASTDISFVPPTPENNSMQISDSVFVNITSAEALGSALLQWVNASGTTNVTMTSASATNWFKEMTSLADGDYSFSVWAQNISGTWVQSGTRSLSIDSANPNVTITYPQNTNYSVDIDTLNYTVSDINLQSCWYSLDLGVTNTTIVCGTNATGLTSVEGSNTWAVYANDSFGNENSASVTFFKDTLNPQISFGAGTAGDNDIVSQNFIYVNVSVVEVNEDTITFTLYNTAGLVNATAYTDGTRETNWTGLSDGVYTYNVTINDTLGNTNATSTRTLTLDTSAPVITFSCDKTTVRVREVISCSCSAASATDASPTISYTQNPSTSSTGKFTTTCSALDDAGVSSSSSISYTVKAKSGGGLPIFNPRESDLSKGYEKIMLKNWKISFKVEGVSHTFTVEDITEKTAKISISSETQEATLSVGEEKKFELSGDGFYDALVRLNAIDTSNANRLKASVTIQTIHEEILEEIVESEIAEEEDIVAAEVDIVDIEEEQKDLTGLGGLILMIIILILSIVAYNKFRNQEY